MTYDFLYHLTQAQLPVVVYDVQLIEKLHLYDLQGLLIVAKQKSSQRLDFRTEKGVQVLKITMAGRRAVRRYLKLEISSSC